MEGISIEEAIHDYTQSLKDNKRDAEVLQVILQDKLKDSAIIKVKGNLIKITPIMYMGVPINEPVVTVNEYALRKISELKDFIKIVDLECEGTKGNNTIFSIILEIKE